MTNTTPDAALASHLERWGPRALLTMAEAAEYLRYTGPNAANSAYYFLRRHGVRLLRRGTLSLVRVEAVDALLEIGKSDFIDRALRPGVEGRKPPE